MSLTKEDFATIRSIVEEVVRPVRDELEALRNDISEIYDMLGELEKSNLGKRQFSKLSVEEKILRVHSELVEAAKQAGVTLPSQN